MKKILTLTLCALLVLLPARAQKQREPKWVLPVVCGIVVLGVGVVVVIELRKACKTLLDPQPANANTNDPPNRAEWITGPGTPVPFVINGKGMSLSDDFVPVWDCSSYGWQDPVNNVLITRASQYRLESSTNCISWTEAFTVCNFTSESGSLMVYSKGGQSVLTNYVTAGQTNYVPLSLGSLNEPKKFFRIKPL